jgi:Tfp pilus assembly protein PilE
MRSQNGFTLVEALVVGIIGSILAGMFIAFMYVHNDAVNRGVARAILLTQSEIVSSRIAAAVRSADRVFAWDEAWSVNPQMNVRRVSSIVVYNNTGVRITGFRIRLSDHKLYEGLTRYDRKVFGTGSDIVMAIDPYSFVLSADRKRVTLDIDYTLQYRGKTYTIPSKKDAYLCRN